MQWTGCPDRRRRSFKGQENNRDRPVKTKKRLEMENSKHKTFLMIRLHRTAVFLCMLLLFLSGMVSGAEGRAKKVVRIPYLASNRLLIVDEDNNPVSGYAYEYIQTIGTYAGWELQYIPCESFSDCMKKLLEGEYDVSYTPERAKQILFPEEPMGNEYYYLYTAVKNTSIVSGDYSTMNGRKVGVTTGTVITGLLKEWCKKRNVKLQFIEYDDIGDKEAALQAGKIDLNLEVSMLAKRNLSAVEKIGSSSYYLVASRNRPDLIEDINTAMDKILNHDLYYFLRLQERYFSETVLSRTLTTEEKKWLEGHKVLRVGYFDKYLPFSAQDKNGRAIGAGVEAIKGIIKALNLSRKLKVEFFCYDNQEEGYRAVESGEVDIMFPAYISNSVKQDYKIMGGKIIATLTSDLAYESNYGNGRIKRIGVNRNNLMQYYYSRDCYPHAKVVFYDDIQGCLNGLLNGTADGTFLNGLRSEALLKPGKYHSIRKVRAKNDFELHMAFAEDSIGLMLLMDRGLTMLDPDFISKAAYSYFMQMNTYTLMDFLQEHILATIITVAFLAALLMALIGFRISNRKLAGINPELKDYSETIEIQRQQESNLRKQLEKNRNELERALQMAQAASRAKTTFLSNMSHDIRTPMNAIIGFTGLAASHIDDKERVQDYLTTISRSSEHLLALINDVLEMSRIESGKITLNRQVESLAEILHGLRDIVRADIQAKQHRFFIEAVNIRNEFVICDKMRINQILLNLVSNAIKYTHPGGTISLRITESPGIKPGYAAFEIRCKDNGIGISENFAKTIFDPFTREENSTVSGIQGTGLGMAITKNIVQMMGGNISIKSKKGEGTEFIISVIFKTADRPASDPANPQLEGLHCLVLCSNENESRNISDMLRSAGMNSEWCVSGEDAAACTEKALRRGDPFKVYVLDWQVPDVNGLETVRRIRKAAGEDAVIIVTADDRIENEKEAREAGVAGFAEKPLFPSDLQKILLQIGGKKLPVPTAGEEQSFSFKGKKVLMVDDSKLNLKVGMLLLKEQGMIVDTAPDGQAAIDMIWEKGIDAYDFVLMDIQMPVMDGYATTAVIRKLPNGDKLKIIAFSANAFEEDKAKSLKAGMNGHIAKPLKISELLAELKRFGV